MNNDIVYKVAKNNNVGFIDIATSISKNKSFFLDEVHYSSKGIEQIAKIIDDKLIPDCRK